MMSGANWAQSKYHGMTREEIKAQWEANRDAAATAGTALRYDIECYYNGMDVMNDSVGMPTSSSLCRIIGSCAISH